MSLDKYYNELFKDGKLNRQYVTYLSLIHINNQLIKKDQVTNKEIVDLGVNFAKKFAEVFNELNYPLDFLFDDIYDIFNYTFSHIKTILNNPKKSIIKEKKLIRKEKLKAIEPKVLAWLSTRPGATIKEKIALANKIPSTQKRYSVNITENQVVLTFYKSLYKLLIKRLEFMRNNESLFGPYNENIKIKKHLQELNKLDYQFKLVFEEVMEKAHTKPNNALIDNVNYRSVWQSYININNKIIDYSDAFNLYKKSFFNWIVLSFFKGYNHLEKPLYLDDVNTYTLYKRDNDELTTITFLIEENLVIQINKNNLEHGRLTPYLKDVYNIEIKEKDDLSERGLAYDLLINEELIGSSFADLLGVKDSLLLINDFFKITPLKKRGEKELINELSLASISSYDNSFYGKNNFSPHIIKNGLMFKPTGIYYSNFNNIYLNSFSLNDYYTLLKETSNDTKNNNNEYLIYDVADDFDDFSSYQLRSSFASSFSKSYPVWRSILAGESITNKKQTKLVIDLCGNIFSISQLSMKKGKFVHHGPIEIKLFYEKYNEHDFLLNYISSYEKKYNTYFPSKVVEDFMFSGAFSDLLLNKTDGHISAYENNDTVEFYHILFDEEIFNSLEKEFLLTLEKLRKNFEVESLVIVPNFISSQKEYIINNKDLLIGANIIKKRVINKEIAWYEMLPDLSLEIIKNGVYDEIILIKDKETENMIGKKYTFDPEETFTLTKGERNYILPLNKSFVGEQNKFFVAKVEDRSFPLKENLDVKLKLEYAPGTEHTYVLFFEPINKEEAPFDKIEVIWEEETLKPNITPDIVDYFRKEELNKEFEKFASLADEINNRFTRVKDGSAYVSYIKNFEKAINILTNVHQNLKNARDPKIDKKVSTILTEKKIVSIIKWYLKRKQKEHLKTSNILPFIIKSLETAIIELEPKAEWYVENKLIYPQSTFGRFFAKKPNDEEVINVAYNLLIKLSNQNNYLDSEELRDYITGLETMIVYNPKTFISMSSTFIFYPKFLLDMIIKILKEMSEYDYDKNINTENRQNNPAQNAYLMRHSMSVLIGYLLIRDFASFSDLKPGTKKAKEIIRYLKIFNKKYNNIKHWPYKTPNLNTRFRFDNIEKPDNLYNVRDEIYVLILYLSGDERANYIQIGVSND